ncbi:MAG: DUF2177 family protein [Gemmatimonadetes bacterium]|uniref:DUF2177 family protein n=1 Tax=Candidatus Kutchimonas denitrificans TaxID=3056748 RepID=A0AAE5C7M1_9BACT|nr:DUF2177 family protein [Gemmatimonadota bacterium]NIR73576.1 DUF2177 family protein [Candidatus Kutchimonas denitrificans]NIR99535.1 DUF2177 family protein [Gemmatimonadota bacterium]NIT65155.1 DUF2177 family protein [Gemmatimonadota bacterium]NIV23688.1 DUF2177 family protein [Gemmatimonadota bacterium]
MRATQLALTYLASLMVFLVLDFAWLGFIARGFYREQLGHLLRPDVRWGAAIMFYLLFVAAVVVLAVLPAVERGSLLRATLLGGFFGLVAYATYDLTNLATLRGFPTLVAAVDMVWGFVLTAIVATAGYLVASRF